ncbi:putative ribonuclease H-like domain-containing protein, partial [Tanacetum coccineum]
MELENTQNNALAKLPILKLGEYEMWEIRIKQYFQIQDYALWEVIENGNSWVPIPVIAPESSLSTALKMIVPSTAEEKICKKNDVKARTRFGGNDATKKTQKALLRQQYENFNASSSESLDSIFNRLQKLVSRLAILGVVTPPEDLNVKFLRSLPSEWDTHVVVWMNKPDFDTMGLDDLYNNFKIIEQKVKRTVAANNDDKNLAFLTTSSPSSTNTINTVNTRVITGTTKVNTASTETTTASFSDVTVYAFLSTQPQGSQLVHEDLEQLHDDDLEEMDLKAPRSKDNRNWNQGSSSKAVKIEDASEKAMCAIDGAGFDWSGMAEDEIQANMALMAFTDSEYDDLLVKLDDTGFKAATYKRGLSILEAQVVKYKESEVLFSEEIALLKRSVGHKEYLMGLLKTELEKVKEEKEGFEFKIAKFEKSSKDLDQLLASQITDKSKKGFGYNVVPSPHPLILNRPTPLDLSYSGLEEFKQPEVNEYSSRDSSLKPTTVCDRESDNSKENTDDSLKQQNKTVTETSSVKSILKVDKDWKEKFFYPANHVREEEPKKARENNDAPIIEDWVSDDEEEVEPIPKVEKKTELYPTVTFIKKEVSLNLKNKLEGQLGSAEEYSCPNAHKHMVPRAVLMKTGLKTVNNARPVNTVRLFKHYFKDFDGGYVTFGGGAKGGRITGKCTIKTDKLDFEDVYFVKELKFNLFSVSQMCDKKNYVLFTYSECLVLSPNFKLPDDNQILLKILRHNNMYSFDMKNIVPKDGLNCLVAKATSEESMLWHRRLGHVNFKNINKLVKENLVRDLPLKRFENDQTCVACLMLHMDIFGPTFVSSLMHKKYYLVVTNDYNRFMGFFFKTKDETSEILKNFIKEIENLVDKKLKIIRSDNETEFKNKVMDDFCREKGCTPQQNGVAERKIRTLIEAARTMPEVNTGSREVSTDVPEVNTPNNETWWDQVLHLKDTQVEDQEIEFGNISPSYEVPTTPHTRIHKDHPIEHVIGNTIQDLHTCLFVWFPLSEDPKRVSQALRDPNMGRGNAAGILQFKRQKVWILVDIPKGYRRNWYKVVYKKTRKMNGGLSSETSKTCCLIRLTQEEGIDYDESLHRGRIEAIRIYFWLCFIMGFMVTKWMAKSAFLVWSDLKRRHMYNRARKEFLSTLVKDGNAGVVDEHLIDPCFSKVLNLLAVKRSLDYHKQANILGKSTTGGVSFWDIGDYIGNARTISSCHLYNEAVYVADAVAVDWFSGSKTTARIWGSDGFHQVIDFLTRSHICYALTKKPEVCVSFIKQFWWSAEISTDDNGEVKIDATIDGHSLSITEGSLRRHLKLDDQDGGALSPQWRFLIHNILHWLSPKKTAWEQFSSNIAAAVICLATNRKFNFSRMIFEHMVSNISSPHKFFMYPRFIQIYLDMQKHQFQQHTRIYPVPSLTMKVFSNMKRPTKGFTGQEVALFPTMLDVTKPSTSPSRITSTPSPSPEPTPAHTTADVPQPSPTQPSPSQPSPTQPSPTQPGSEHHVPTPHDSPLHAVHLHGS